MLRRSEQDVRDLAEYKPVVRLCKGIYKEARTVAFTDREEVRANYRKLLRLMLDGGFYPAIATHDDPLIDDARALIKERGLRPDQYEFQMLLGVKRERAPAHPGRRPPPAGVRAVRRGLVRLLDAAAEGESRRWPG